jgi:hypothetical protein
LVLGSIRTCIQRCNTRSFRILIDQSKKIPTGIPIGIFCFQDV